MEWIKSILEKHTGEDGKLDLDGAIKAINKAAPENVVPKEQYNSLSESKKQLEVTVGERDKQLEELKAAGSVEDLQAQITKLQGDNAQKDKDFQEKIATMKYDSAIEKALSDAIHPDLIGVKIDRTKLKLNEDDTITGLEEQVKTLKESYKDQFKPTKIGKTPPNPEDGNPSGKKVSEMNYGELAAYRAANPDATLD